MRNVLVLITCLLLGGCFHLSGIEHTMYGGITRSESGGEIYSEQPSGHQEQGGSWHIGTAVKTIWKLKE